MQISKFMHTMQIYATYANLLDATKLFSNHPFISRKMYFMSQENTYYNLWDDGYVIMFSIVIQLCYPSSYIHSEFHLNVIYQHLAEIPI